MKHVESKDVMFEHQIDLETAAKLRHVKARDPFLFILSEGVNNLEMSFRGANNPCVLAEPSEEVAYGE